MNLENIIIVQNKIDLTKEENYKQIKTFVKGIKAANHQLYQYQVNINIT